MKQFILSSILMIIICLFTTCINTKYPIKKKIYIEPDSLVNSNNQIYKVNTCLKFNYYFIKNNDTLLCLIEEGKPKVNSDFKLVSYNSSNDNLITSLSGEVQEQQIIKGQTALRIEYLNTNQEKLFIIFPGIVENEHNHWWHPPRSFYFYVTEFSPFPYIKYPFKKGLSWTSKIFLYPIEDNDRWIPKFEGTLTIESTYKITGKTKLQTKLGNLTCYVTEAEAINPYGKGYLTSYFNEKYGFVKLDYTNIDGSRLVIEMIDFQQPKKEEK